MITFLRHGINPELAPLQGFVTQLALATGTPLMAVQFACSAWQTPGRDGRMTTMGASVVGFAFFSLALGVEAYASLIATTSMVVLGGAGVTIGRLDPPRAGLAFVGAVLLTFGAWTPVLAVQQAVFALAGLAVVLALPERPADW